jgi:cell wall assembly regulator SMI1
MRFINSKDPLTSEDIATVERDLGLQFPASVREHFLRANGGRPDPNVYRDQDEDVGVTVHQCLPLLGGRGSAVAIYQNLVVSKSVVPRSFLPFAIDPGGDILFVDCASPAGLVYLWHHEIPDDEPLVPLNVGLDEFWSRLKPKE